jgi:hypothetical protein
MSDRDAAAGEPWTARIALARRWACRPRRAVVAPIAVLGPAPIVLDGDAHVVEQVADRSLRHHLGAIDAWVRTLDERWQALSEADKRIALEIIHRNTRAAIDQLSELSVSA